MRHPMQLSRSQRMWPEIDDMLERAFRNPFSLLDDTTPQMESAWYEPAFDVHETDQAYLLSVDLPGVKKEDVKVDVSDNVLTVSGERRHEETNAKRSLYSYGKFSRSFTLPLSVEADKVEAHLEDGVLRLALPKSERAKSRAVQVQSGKGGFFSKLIGSQTGSQEAAKH